VSGLALQVILHTLSLSHFTWHSFFPPKLCSLFLWLSIRFLCFSFGVCFFLGWKNSAKRPLLLLLPLGFLIYADAKKSARSGDLPADCLPACLALPTDVPCPLPAASCLILAARLSSVQSGSV